MSLSQLKSMFSFSPMFSPAPSECELSLKSFQSFRSLAVGSYSEVWM